MSSVSKIGATAFPYLRQCQRDALAAIHKKKQPTVTEKGRKTMRNPIDFYIRDMDRQRRGVVVLKQLTNGNIVAASALCHPNDEFDPIAGKNKAYGRLESETDPPTLCATAGRVVIHDLWSLLYERHPAGAEELKFWLHHRSAEVYTHLIDRMMHPPEPKPKPDLLEWARMRVARVMLFNLSNVQVVEGDVRIGITGHRIYFADLERLSAQFKTADIVVEHVADGFEVVIALPESD